MNADYSDYSVETDPSVMTKRQLVADLRTVVADAEALLRATADQGGEAVAAVRAKVEASLAGARQRLADAHASLQVRAREAAHTTDEYVHTHPWQAVGTAAGIGLVIGLLIGRR